MPKDGWVGTLADLGEARRLFLSRSDLFHLVEVAGDLNDIEKDSRVHVVMNVQNPTWVGTDWTRLDDLWKVGVRVIQLAYWDECVYGCGYLATEDTGLTEAGHKFLRELAARGFILDLSHSGHRTALEAAKLYQGKVMISHTGSQGVYDSPRNASDELIQLVANRGGIVGIYTMTFFLDQENNGLDVWLRHVQHIANLVGQGKVVVGTDGPVGGFLDLEAAHRGFEQLTRVLDRSHRLEQIGPRWPAFIPELDGAERYQVMERRLKDQFGREASKNIMGANALRFYREALPK